MKRKSYSPYALLALSLFGCLNVPNASIDPLRGHLINVISPIWKEVFRIHIPFPRSLNFASQWEGSKEHMDEVRARFENEFQTSTMARVIYRQPSFWSSFVWIDVGETHSPLVQVNSPVLVDHCLIGLVEFVGKKCSRVRLVTDPSLVIAVRAVRGARQNREMMYLIDQLFLEFSLLKGNLFSVEEKKSFFEQLIMIREKFKSETNTLYLAKGEIFGTCSSLYRSLSSKLKGVGFNYDFADERGPARELRSGKPYANLLQKTGMMLIQEGDLLVTSGMDGVFPEGIPVAVVSKVDPLKEGDTSFSIEAQLHSEKMHDLSRVHVLPSLGLERGEKEESFSRL